MQTLQFKNIHHQNWFIAFLETTNIPKCVAFISFISIYIYITTNQQKWPSHTQAWRTISSSTPSSSTDSSAIVSLHAASARCRRASSQSARVTSLDMETELGAATHSFDVTAGRRGGSDWGCCCPAVFEPFWSWKELKNGWFWSCRFEVKSWIDCRVNGFFSEHSRIKSDPQIYPNLLFYQMHTSPNARPSDIHIISLLKRSQGIRDFSEKFQPMKSSNKDSPGRSGARLNTCSAVSSPERESWIPFRRVPEIFIPTYTPPNIFVM